MAKLTETRRLKKLPYDGVQNAWNSTLPDPKPTRVLQQDVTADCAMLSGGTCGLTFARRLAELRPDDSIAVVEAMRVGYRTFGRNAVFMLKHCSHGGIKNSRRQRTAAGRSRTDEVICAISSNSIRFAANGTIWARFRSPPPRRAKRIATT